MFKSGLILAVYAVFTLRRKEKNNSRTAGGHKVTSASELSRVHSIWSIRATYKGQDLVISKFHLIYGPIDINSERVRARKLDSSFFLSVA